jgi:ABC-type nitrate/sulfonate/bicarbonate transport system permease component
MLRLSRTETIRKIILPAARPLMIVGLRLALSFSLVLAIVAEVAGNPSGLGNAIVSAQQALHPDEMFAYVLAIGALGVALNAAFNAIARRVIPSASWSAHA